jgi:hypothetical protein
VRDINRHGSVHRHTLPRLFADEYRSAIILRGAMAAETSNVPFDF